VQNHRGSDAECTGKRGPFCSRYCTVDLFQMWIAAKGGVQEKAKELQRKWFIFQKWREITITTQFRTIRVRTRLQLPFPMLLGSRTASRSRNHIPFGEPHPAIQIRWPSLIEVHYQRCFDSILLLA